MNESELKSAREEILNLKQLLRNKENELINQAKFQNKFADLKSGRQNFPNNSNTNISHSGR